MPNGCEEGVGTGNSVMTPADVIRPILLPVCSVNQRFASGPSVIIRGSLPAVGIGKSLQSEVSNGAQTPILFALLSVNQIHLSGPTATPHGADSAVEGVLAAVAGEFESQ